MMLTAIVREKGTRHYQTLRMDYPTKEHFAADCRRNGYEVRTVGNNRDLAAWDYGFKSFSEMKREAKDWQHCELIYQDRMERIARIAAIEL